MISENITKRLYIFLILLVVGSTTYAEIITENNNQNIPLSEENKEENKEEDKEVEDIKIKDTKEINKTNTIKIQALNKITAKSYEYKIKIGDSIEFERLIITPLFCWKSAPSDIPENKALLKISENQLNKEQKEIFYGWMFSSAPSISSLEHPMYDIKVVDCLKIQDEK